ncbi:MAG: hypothetical protein ABI923_04490 [bacterium]
MIQENDIRIAAGSYLSGQQPLENFEDWLAQHSWNMHQDSDRAAQDLASKIELALAEYSADHLSEDELRSQLRRLISTYFVSFNGGGGVAYDLVSTSTSITQRPLVDIIRVAVS